MQTTSSSCSSSSSLKWSIGTSKFTVKNLKTNEAFQAQVVPKFMQDMLMEDRMVEYYKRHKRFPGIQEI
jgi:hypothetical protein